MSGMLSEGVDPQESSSLFREQPWVCLCENRGGCGEIAVSEVLPVHESIMITRSQGSEGI